MGGVWWHPFLQEVQDDVDAASELVEASLVRVEVAPALLHPVGGEVLERAAARQEPAELVEDRAEVLGHEGEFGRDDLLEEECA